MLEASLPERYMIPISLDAEWRKNRGDDEMWDFGLRLENGREFNYRFKWYPSGHPLYDGVHSELSFFWSPSGKKVFNGEYQESPIRLTLMHPAVIPSTARYQTRFEGEDVWRYMQGFKTESGNVALEVFKLSLPRLAGIRGLPDEARGALEELVKAVEES